MVKKAHGKSPPAGGGGQFCSPAIYVSIAEYFVLRITNIVQCDIYVLDICLLFSVSRSQSSSVSHFKNSATAEMHMRIEVYANRCAPQYRPAGLS